MLPSILSMEVLLTAERVPFNVHVLMPSLSEALVEGYDPAAEAACGRSEACHFRFIFAWFAVCFVFSQDGHSISH